MATVAKSTVIVTKTVEVEEPVITLTLSVDEAAVVRAAVGAVCVSGKGRSAYDIYTALSSDSAVPKLYADRTITVTTTSRFDF